MSDGVTTQPAHHPAQFDELGQQAGLAFRFQFPHPFRHPVSGRSSRRQLVPVDVHVILVSLPDSANRGKTERATGVVTVTRDPPPCTLTPATPI